MTFNGETVDDVIITSCMPVIYIVHVCVQEKYINKLCLMCLHVTEGR